MNFLRQLSVLFVFVAVNSEDVTRHSVKYTPQESFGYSTDCIRVQLHGGLEKQAALMTYIQ